MKMPMRSLAISKPAKYKKKDLHNWADHIELLCVVNKDGAISQNDFLDRQKPKRDLVDSEDFGGDRKNIEINETNSQFAEDCFKVLEYRVEAFKEYYPFEVSRDGKILTFGSDLTNKNRIYLSLLFSSLLGPCKDYTSPLTSSFELLSHQALKSLLPEEAKTYIFGSSNIEEIDDAAVKSSKLWDKLNELVAHIKENVTIPKEALSKYNNGDAGLDIYAWIELGDKNKHLPLFFCQCACTPDWDRKQNSSKYDRWSNYITLATYPVNIIFIPYSFRSATGEWHEFQKIEKTILIDRQRLLFCLKGNEEVFLASKSFEVVDEILRFKESVV